MSSSSSSNKECEKCGQVFNSSQAYEMHLNNEKECSTDKRREDLEDAGLSEAQAEAYSLFQEGYSAKRISQIIQKNEGTVETHLQRSRDKISEAQKLVELTDLKKPEIKREEGSTYERNGVKVVHTDDSRFEVFKHGEKIGEHEYGKIDTETDPRQVNYLEDIAEPFEYEADPIEEMAIALTSYYS